MASPSARSSILKSAPESDAPPNVLTAEFAYGIFAALSGLFVSLWFSPNDSAITLLIAVFFLAMFGVRFWSVGLILITVQAGLFLAESPTLSAYRDSPGSSLLAIGVLALLISSCRYLTLTSSPTPYRLSNRSSVKVAIHHARRHKSRKTFAAFGVLPRDGSTVGSAELFTMLGRMVLPVATVSMLLTLVPLDPNTPNNARLFPSAVRTISLGIILLSICVMANSLMNVLVWRKLSPAEATIFLRSELSKWIHREVSRVSRRRIRFRSSRRH